MDVAVLDDMLWDLGELLDARGHRYHLAVIGGTALLLQEIVHRTTRDVDVVGVEGDDGWVALETLPDPLAAAVIDIANLYGEDADWLNIEPSGLLEVGLPTGWTTRLSRRDYGGALTLSVLGREDLICTKLYALTDQSPTSKHADDLLALAPTTPELGRAADWCRLHDPSPGFADQLEQALSWLRSRLS